MITTLLPGRGRLQAEAFCEIALYSLDAFLSGGEFVRYIQNEDKCSMPKVGGL